MSLSDPISVFYSKFSRYPGNNKQWWLARAEVDDPDASPAIKAGDFLPEILDKLFSGNMRAPRGHFILDAFNKDRSFVSGIADLTTVTTTSRPRTTAFFSGRAWFACESNVYFSQVLTDKHRAGLCYQEADPTSEQVSDLVDTDGGVIPIPEALDIVKLLPHGGGMLVFAINGVWDITGTSAGFSATDISVNKVSPIGCRSPNSIIETEEAVFWWGETGVLAMKQSSGMYGPIPGQFDKLNISESTIQTFYNNIPASARAEAKGVFDPKANVVAWLYRDEDIANYQYNKMLLFDLSLQAFYPWEFSLIEDGPVIKGTYISIRENDYDSVATGIDPSFMEFNVMLNDKMRFAQVNSTEFADWFTYDGTGVSYNSFVEAGYELFGDAMRNKNITYLFSYFRRTEQELIDGEPDDPSSCFMRVKWDWASGQMSNKWTDPVQAYRPSRVLFDSADTGFSMVITKSKVRGNGKAIQFRYGTDEIGRNFDLQGWAIAVTGNTVP